MKSKRTRTEIPPEVAARLLFLSDRTCCVCRVRGKPVQIHHLDENPSNHDPANLAVLCFDCHRGTQLTGGFDRKLDGHQVALYRDDWQQLVAQERSRADAKREAARYEKELNVALATSVAEIYRENDAFEALAVHYYYLGNAELRDKYIELAIRRDPSDATITYLRGLQGRPDLIPSALVKRRIGALSRHKAWQDRARLFMDLRRPLDAVKDYVRTVHESLEEDNVFSAAFYLKELAAHGLVEELFGEALSRATRRRDLWWQVRALQELGWQDELNRLLRKNAARIRRGHGLPDTIRSDLQILLAEAKGDEQKALELRKQTARLRADSERKRRPRVTTE